MTHIWISLGIGISTFLLTLFTLAFKLGQFNSRFDRITEDVGRVERNVKKIRSLLFREDGSLNYVSVASCKDTKETLRKELEMNMTISYQNLTSQIDSLSKDVGKVIQTNNTVLESHSSISSALTDFKEILKEIKRESHVKN